MAASKSSVSGKKKASASRHAKPPSGVPSVERAAPRTKTKTSARDGKTGMFLADERPTARGRPQAAKPAGSHAAPRVSVVTAGGYTVFGSPVRPAHLTPEQIAVAIADLD